MNNKNFDNLQVDLGRNQPTRDGSPGSILSSRKTVEQTVDRQRQALVSYGEEIAQLLTRIDNVNKSVSEFDKSLNQTFSKSSQMGVLNKETDKLGRTLLKVNSTIESGNIKVEDLAKLYEEVFANVIDAQGALDDVNLVYDSQTGKIREQNKLLKEQSRIRKHVNEELKKARKQEMEALKKDIKEQQKDLVKSNLNAVKSIADRMKGLVDTANLGRLAELSDKGSAADIQFRLQQSYGLDKQGFNAFKREAMGGLDLSTYSSKAMLEGFESLKDMNLTADKAAEYLPMLVKGQQLLGMNADTQSKLIALGNRLGRDTLAFTTNKIAQFMKHGNDLSLKSLNELMTLNTNLASEMADIGIDSEEAMSTSANAMKAMLDVFGENSGKERIYAQAQTTLAGSTDQLSEMLGLETGEFRDFLNEGGSLFELVNAGQGRLGDLYSKMTTNYDEVVGDLDKYTQGIDASLVQLVKSMVDSNRIHGKSLIDITNQNKATERDGSALDSIENSYKESIGIFGKFTNIMSNTFLKEFDWQDLDNWRKHLLFAVMGIQAILTASELASLGKSLFKWVGKAGGVKGVSSMLSSKAVKTAGGVGGAVWMGIDAFKGYGNKEMHGEGAGVGSKLGSAGLSALSSSTVHRKDDGSTSYGKNIGWGAASGAAKGALIGSVIPGVGTAIGGAVGALMGGLAGWGKSAKAEKQEKLQEEQLKQQKKIADATAGSQAALDSLRNIQFSQSAIPRSALYDGAGGGSSPFGMGGIANKKSTPFGHWIVTSPYGTRTHIENGKAVPGKTSFHKGIDFGRNKDNPIGAATSGIVTASGWQGGYGNAVTVRGDDGLTYVYAHMRDTPAVDKGERVSGGDVLGIVGSTGNSTGAHLHFEVRKGATAVEPSSYVNDSIWMADGIDRTSDFSSMSKVDQKKSSLLQSLAQSYKVDLGYGGIGGDDRIVSGLSDIKTTLINLSDKQSDQEKLLGMLQGKRTPSPRA